MAVMLGRNSVRQYLHLSLLYLSSSGYVRVGQHSEAADSVSRPLAEYPEERREVSAKSGQHTNTKWTDAAPFAGTYRTQTEHDVHHV